MSNKNVKIPIIHEKENMKSHFYLSNLQGFFQIYNTYIIVYMQYTILGWLSIQWNRLIHIFLERHKFIIIKTIIICIMSLKNSDNHWQQKLFQLSMQRENAGKQNKTKQSTIFTGALEQKHKFPKV